MISGVNQVDILLQTQSDTPLALANFFASYCWGQFHLCILLCLLDIYINRFSTLHLAIYDLSFLFMKTWEKL